MKPKRLCFRKTNTMKNYFYLTFAIIILATQFAIGKPGNGCIDPTLINPNAICPAVYDPVCGCDGITYGNSCEAAAAGVTSFSQGDCDGVIVNDCIDENLINPNAICPEIYAPVCGCDGITYENICRAEAAGVTSYFEGDCFNNGGSCIDSSLIDLSLGCPMYYAPVCGCNGITYGNECDARINGVTNFYYGECGTYEECNAIPYFYYAIDTNGKTVYFMNFSAIFFPFDDVDSTNTTFPGTGNGIMNTEGLSVLWDFGDGNTSTAFNPTYTYASDAAGNYTVCLTVYDSINDCSNQYCEVLFDYTYVGNCGADFDWEIIYDDETEKDSIVFINNTPDANDPNVVVSWSFGDGNFINGVNDSAGVAEPGYIFDEDGDYTVCMSVTNMNNGCFDIICNTVEYRKYNSVINKKQLQDFKVYPNPANNKVFISLNNIASTVKISVTDLSGKVLHAFEKNNVVQGIQVFEWNAENVYNGLYIVHVQSGNASAYKRLSIMH